MKAVYEISLDRVFSFDDYMWTWELRQDEELLATQNASFRWTAVRAAKRAARRHTKGKPPLRIPRDKEATVFYRP